MKKTEIKKQIVFDYPPLVYRLLILAKFIKNCLNRYIIKMKPFDPKLAQISKSKDPCALILELSSIKPKESQWYESRFSHLLFFYERAQFQFEGVMTKIKMFYERPKHRSKGVKQIKKFLEQFNDLKHRLIYINNLKQDEQNKLKKFKREQKIEKIERINKSRQENKQSENTNEENKNYEQNESQDKVCHPLNIIIDNNMQKNKNFFQQNIVQETNKGINNKQIQQDFSKFIVAKSEYEKRIAMRMPGEKMPVMIEIDSQQVRSQKNGQMIPNIANLPDKQTNLNSNNFWQPFSSSNDSNKNTMVYQNQKLDSFYNQQELEQLQSKKNQALVKQIFELLQSVKKNNNNERDNNGDQKEDFNINFDY